MQIRRKDNEIQTIYTYLYVEDTRCLSSIVSQRIFMHKNLQIHSAPRRTSERNAEAVNNARCLQVYCYDAKAMAPFTAFL